MTLWLWNLVAYSVQLAVLVGTGALIISLLGVTRPRANLLFWQGVLAASLLWPGYQVWSSVAHWGGASGALDVIFSSNSLWDPAPRGAADIQVVLAALGPGGTALSIAVLAIGAIVRLAWIGVGLRRLRSIRATSESADGLSSLASSLQHQLGTAAEIRFSDAVDSPATIGLRRPLVLLPRSVRDLSYRVQRAVLCHELMHVRRRDWLPALFEEALCAVLWFHPAVRALASRLSLARETVVDEATIGLTGDRRAYAAALLTFSAAQSQPFAATRLIGRRHLARRVDLITQEVSMSRFSLVTRLAAAGLAVCLATIATSSSLPISATLHAQPDKVYTPGKDSGVTLPRVVSEVKPKYTAAAMQAKVQGTVWMQAVVLASGDVGDVAVTRSLDKEHGLDQQAVDAARQWKFEPGTKDGKPVPVAVTIEMTFTLKK